MPLYFDQAKAYMESDKAAPEYASTSFGEFGPLTDGNCTALFGKVPGAGPGFISTGKHKGGDLGGPEIYALRGANPGRGHWTKADLTAWLDQISATSCVLLACRAQ